MKLAVVGNGRMGSAAAECAADRGHEIVVELRGDALRRGPQHWIATARGAEAALEFTHGEIAEANAVALIGAGVPVISGTTGWTPSKLLVGAVESSGGGFLLAPNFSVGVNLFFRAAGEAARLLAGSGVCQPYIVEHHHRGKRDAPSGTARRLAAVVREAVPSLEIVEGDSQGGVSNSELHVVSVRAGDEPGAHLLGFDGPHDTIRLEHHARGRGGFALGAVLAAEWLVGRSGVRSFDEVLDAWLEGSPGSARPAEGPGGR
jgi:4-hydroxy-tetrahydrodipicolinate reductase